MKVSLLWGLATILSVHARPLLGGHRTQDEPTEPQGLLHWHLPSER